MVIVIAKGAFNRKISLLTNKLNIELRKKLLRCYVGSIALYDSDIWTLRKLERKYLESFEVWCWIIIIITIKYAVFQQVPRLIEDTYV